MASKFGINPGDLRHQLDPKISLLDLLTNPVLWDGLDLAAETLYNWRLGITAIPPTYPGNVMAGYQSVIFVPAYAPGLTASDTTFFSASDRDRLNNSVRYWNKHATIPVDRPGTYYSLADFVSRFDHFLPTQLVGPRQNVYAEELVGFLYPAKEAHSVAAVVRPASLQLYDVTPDLVNMVSSTVQKKLETNPASAVTMFKAMATSDQAWWVTPAASNPIFRGVTANFKTNLLNMFTPRLRALDNPGSLLTTLKALIAANPGRNRAWLYSWFGIDPIAQPMLSPAAYLDYLSTQAPFNDPDSNEGPRQLVLWIGEQASGAPRTLEFACQVAFAAMSALFAGTNPEDLVLETEIQEMIMAKATTARAASAAAEVLRKKTLEGDLVWVRNFVENTVGTIPSSAPANYGGLVLPTTTDATAVPGSTTPPPAGQGAPAGAGGLQPAPISGDPVPTFTKMLMKGMGATAVLSVTPMLSSALSNFFSQQADDNFRRSNGLALANEFTQKTDQAKTLSEASHESMWTGLASAVSAQTLPWAYNEVNKAVGGLYAASPEAFRKIAGPTAAMLGPMAQSVLGAPMLNAAQQLTNSIMTGKFDWTDPLGSPVFTDLWTGIQGNFGEQFGFSTPITQRRLTSQEQTAVSVILNTSANSFAERTAQFNRTFGKPRAFLQFYTGALNGVSLEFTPLPGISSAGDSNPNPIGLPGIVMRTKMNEVSIAIAGSFPTIQSLGVLSDTIELSGIFLPFKTTSDKANEQQVLWGGHPTMNGMS